MSQQLKEIGTLVVVVLKAQHLHQPSFYKQSPYVQVSLSGQKRRTKVDSKGGQHPVWDDELRFPVLADVGKDNVNRILEVSCYKDEQRGDDVFLGKGTVNVEETLKTGEFDDWVPLETSAGARGEVYLEMTFYANSPPPLTRRPSKLNPSDRLTRPAAYSAQGRQPSSTSTSPSPQRRTLPTEIKPSQPPPAGMNQIPSSLIPARGAKSQTSGQTPLNGSTTSVVTVKHKNDSLPPLPSNDNQLDVVSGKSSGLPAALHPGGGSGPRSVPPNRTRGTSTGRPPPEILPEPLHRRTLSDTPVVAPFSQLQAPVQTHMIGPRVGSAPSIVIEEHIEDPPGLPFPVPLPPPQGLIQQHQSRSNRAAGNYDTFSYGPPEQSHMQSHPQSYMNVPTQGYPQTFPRSSPAPLGQPQQAYDASSAITSPQSLPQHYTQYPGTTTLQALSPQAYPPLPQQVPYPTHTQQHPLFHQQSHPPHRQEQYLPSPEQQQYHPQHLPYAQPLYPPNVSQPYQQSGVTSLQQQPYSNVSQQPPQSHFAIPPPPPPTLQSHTPRPYTPQPTPQLQSYFSPPPPPPPPPPIQLHDQGVRNPPLPTPSQGQIPPPTSSMQSITPVSPLTQSPTATSIPLPLAPNNASTSSIEEAIQQRQAEEGVSEVKSIAEAVIAVEQEVRWTPQNTATNISEEPNVDVEDERLLGQPKDAEEQISQEENKSSQQMEGILLQQGEEELQKNRESEKREEQMRQELEHQRQEEEERKNREEEDRRREEERREMEAEERRKEEELKKMEEERRKREEEERRRREQELKKRDEEERQRREEEERKKREEEVRRREEEARRKREELRREEERRRKEEEERAKREEERRRREEEERRRREEERAKREEERRRREEEERRRREVEERAKREEERRRREEEERRRREEEERAKREEERRRREEERRRREEEERKRREEEAEHRRKVAEEEARRRAEQAEAERRWQEELARIRARAEQEAADEAFARAQMEAEELARRKQEEADMEVARREQAHEEELERRRQEERKRKLEDADRELARRLDMELNLGRDRIDQSRQRGAPSGGRR